MSVALLICPIASHYCPASDTRTLPSTMRNTGTRTGLLLAAIGGLTISFDVPTIRLALSDPYTTMLVRGFGLAIMLSLATLLLRGSKNASARLLRDRDFLIVGLTYGVGNVLFTIAVFNTSTANLLFILAFIPMIAALLAWVLIGERPRPATWAAIFATISGVAIIVGDGLSRGSGFGEAVTLGTALSVAYAIVHSRKSGKDMSLAPALGGLVSIAYTLPFVWQHLQWPGAPGWLLLDGFVIIPLAASTLALAPRYIPAAQSSMFYLLETVLAPLWVWLIFSEVPTTTTFIGGTIILTAILTHSIWQLRRTKPASTP